MPLNYKRIIDRVVVVIAAIALNMNFSGKSNVLTDTFFTNTVTLSAGEDTVQDCCPDPGDTGNYSDEAVILPAFDESYNYSLSSIEDIRVSLLTIDPGIIFYSVFGHSAIRIKIDSSNYDFVYNYGMFSFNKPDFYYDLVSGKMIFYMTKEPYDSFISKYEHEKRSVHEQVFAMDSAQTMFVCHYLENNLKIENRYYRYLFLHDNCATRIRDIVPKTFNDITLPESHETFTYRGLVHRYLQKYPWGKLIIDIVFGLPLDRKIDLYEQMFLPDNLSDVFARTLSHGQQIVKETNILFVSEQPDIQPLGLITPTVVCCIVLVLSLLFSYMRKVSIFFYFLILFSVGMVGMLITFLWFFSDHTTVAVNNLNIIWALPTHTVMAFFLLLRRGGNFTRKYFLTTAIISVLLIASWIFLPQRLNPALIALILAIALRGRNIYYLPKTQKL
jgi:hypothetical protein